MWSGSGASLSPVSPSHQPTLPPHQASAQPTLERGPSPLPALRRPRRQTGGGAEEPRRERVVPALPPPPPQTLSGVGTSHGPSPSPQTLSGEREEEVEEGLEREEEVEVEEGLEREEEVEEGLEREEEEEEGLEREEEVEEGLEREEQVEESLLARPLVVLQRHYKVRLRRLRRRRCGREFCTVSPRPQYHGNGQRASSEPNVSKGGHNPMIQRGLNWHRMNIKALMSPPVNC
ncbi:unnamed protein product [Gadus morhua 'NCC']